MAVEALELAPDLGVVPAEQLLPSLVAELDRSLRGVDDVGKQHDGQDALDRRQLPDTDPQPLAFTSTNADSCSSVTPSG